MGFSVLGCRVSYSRLNEELGIPFSFECTLEGGGVESYSDVVRVAREAAGELSTLLGGPLRVSRFSGWEYIGGRFNLYNFDLEHQGVNIGVLRVVEAGGYPLNVTGVLAGAARLYFSLLSQAGPGFVESHGYNLGITYLKPGGGGDPPPGQKYIRDFVIYGVEGIQFVEASGWRLRVGGRVYKPLELGLGELLEASGDGGSVFHCVTGWSVRGRTWGGVPLETLLSKASLAVEGGGWLAAVSTGGYATVMPLEEALKGGMVAVLLDGKPLTPEAGYPARLYIPHLYGWKHCKWLREILVLDSYEDGYWEALSYHERGLVASEERFKVRNTTIAGEGALPHVRRPLRPS